ncbi:hypothetical protein MAPG_09592 [Magnaporthiopsis poae ATCC 64411]|uniref:BTB domain-containing protein n=1 Tax=Magnaporthiopsis poae (strain ATCC 64411 / 73-15) TaxID=644358 RepID=A0A0C4EAC6_MAGP6|nr:hypothetical protein MAPG_09592 [Magnaporthiopsis poae ATCC 64411]
MSSPAYNPIAQLLVDRTFSDVTVTCAGGSTFHLHRAILGAQSEYFAKACWGPFSVKKAASEIRPFLKLGGKAYSQFISFKQEASSGKVDLPDVDPEVFKKLVDFVYTGTYTDFFTPNAEGLLLKAHTLPSGVWKCTMGRNRSRKEQEPLHNQPVAINPPMIQSVSLEVVSEQLEIFASLMGPTIPVRQGKRKADDDESKSKASGSKARTDGADRSSIPFPYSIHHHLANWGHHPHRIHKSFRYGERSEEVESTLYASAKVYIIADRFMVPALKMLSLMRFGAAVTHITGRLDIVGSSGEEDRTTIMYDAQKLFDTVDFVYANTATVDVALKEPLCRLLLTLGLDFPRLLARVHRLARNNSELGANILSYTEVVGILTREMDNQGICPECRKETLHTHLNDPPTWRQLLSGISGAEAPPPQPGVLSSSAVGIFQAQKPRVDETRARRRHSVRGRVRGHRPIVRYTVPRVSAKTFIWLAMICNDVVSRRNGKCEKACETVVWLGVCPRATDVFFHISLRASPSAVSPL